MKKQFQPEINIYFDSYTELDSVGPTKRERLFIKWSISCLLTLMKNFRIIELSENPDGSAQALLVRKEVV